MMERGSVTPPYGGAPVQFVDVFPLTPGSKVPLPARLDCCGGSHRRGCTDALDNVHAARAWWRNAWSRAGCWLATR